MDTELLVDDELVSLAVTRESHWPGPLPTVDVETAQELTAAAFRGSRSLRVRGLLTDADEPFNGILDRLRRNVVGATRSLTLYLGDRDGQPRTWEAAVASYALGSRSQWLVDEMTASGVHQFRELATEDVRDLLSGRLTGVLSTERDDDTPPADAESSLWWCLSAATGLGAEVLAVNLGVAFQFRIDVEGRLTGPRAPVGRDRVMGTVGRLMTVVTTA